MRSETVRQILSEISEETKQKVRKTANRLVESVNLFPADGNNSVIISKPISKGYSYLKKWRLNNPEKNKIINANAQRKWAKNNPEKIKEKSKRQYINRKLKRLNNT